MPDSHFSHGGNDRWRYRRLTGERHQQQPSFATTSVGVKRRYSVAVWTLPEHGDMELFETRFVGSLGRLALAHQLSGGRWKHFR
jgi:hypothetical protein